MQSKSIEVETGARSAWRKHTARGVIVALLSTMLVTAMGVSPAAAGCSSGSIESLERQAESGFVTHLNNLRRSSGRSTLTVNSGISSPAADWSATMSSQDWLHHARDVSASDGVTAAQDYVTLISRVVPNWTNVAENVGYRSLSSCSAVDSTVRALHDSFVASSGHHRNMVGDFNQVGVGVHIDSSRMWVTVRFAKGSTPAAVGSGSARYIDAAHRLFVNRGATSGEKQFWGATVQSGNRRALTNALAVSNEWAGVRVNDLYKTVLGRNADGQGRAFWVSKIAGGLRLEAVAVEMYGSEEYFMRQGRTNRGFVAGLYRDILGRSAEAAGLRYWTSLLDRGQVDRASVASGFYASLESRLDRVSTLYREILGRSPDGAGHRYWADRLVSIGDVVLAAELGSSQEFYLRATR